MSEIRNLGQFLRPLEAFGLQYFSLSKFNFILSSRFASFGYKVYFFCYTASIVLLMIYFREPYLDLIQKLSINENMLGYAIEMIVTIFILGQISVNNFEAFITVKSNQNFFKILHKFDKFLDENLDTKIITEKLRKILKHRLILIASLIVIISIPHSKVVIDHGFHGFFTFCMIINYFIIICMWTYKLCFYVDVIGICLVKFHEILDQIEESSHDKKEMLMRIYKCRRCYVYIIEILDELNSCMIFTLNLYIFCGTLWITLRFYYFLQLNIEDPASFTGEFNSLRIFNVTLIFPFRKYARFIHCSFNVYDIKCSWTKCQKFSK